VGGGAPPIDGVFFGPKNLILITGFSRKFDPMHQFPIWPAPPTDRTALICPPKVPRAAARDRPRNTGKGWPVRPTPYAPRNPEHPERNPLPELCRQVAPRAWVFARPRDLRARNKSAFAPRIAEWFLRPPPAPDEWARAPPHRLYRDPPQPGPVTADNPPCATMQLIKTRVRRRSRPRPHFFWPGPARPFPMELAGALFFLFPLSRKSFCCFFGRKSGQPWLYRKPCPLAI